MHLSLRSAILMTACMILAASAHAQTCDASFRAEVSGCNVVSFIPTEVNPTFSYAWDFGDGKTSTVSNPVHTYVSYGNLTQSFTAKLTLTKEGCTDTETKTVTVKQVPDATIEDASGNAFLDCSESGLLTISNGSTTKNTNTSYRIKWGDGSSVTEVSAFDRLTHEYPGKGNYFIEVTVTGQNGCVTVATNSFIWSVQPNIGLNLPSNEDICLPGTARVIISGVENNTPNTKYRVEANDGSSSATFNHPPPLTYDHLFENTSCETTSIINNKEHNHAFQISITASTGCPNQEASAAVGPIRTRTEPKAGFEVKPGEKICASDLVEVTSTAENGSFYSSQFDSCEDTMRVTWDVFPASGYSFQQKNAEGLKINFSQPGTYTIRQIVENAVTARSDADPLCAADTLQKTICIIPEPLSSFRLSAGTNAGCTPFVNKLINTSNTLNSCEAARYEWKVEYVDADCGPGSDYDFLDSTNANTQDAHIRFNTGGAYRVSLTTTNSCGKDTYSDTIFVTGNVTAAILEIPDTCGIVTIQPTLEQTKLCAEVPVTYVWTFPAPHNKTFTGTNPPPLTYDQPGTYTIRLTTEACNTTTTEETFTIYPLSDEVQIGANTPCPGSPLVFSYNNKAAGQTCLWEGPNGFSSTECEPRIEMAGSEHEGEYCLTVTNENGCAQQKCITVRLLEKPELQLNSDTLFVCKGEVATLQASGAITYAWEPDQYVVSASITQPELKVAPPPGTWLYTVNGSNSLNCTALDTIIVVVLEDPQATLELPEFACAGEEVLPIRIQTNRTGTGVWSVTPPPVSLDQETGAFVAPDSGIYVVTYTFTDVYGCPAAPVSESICIRQNPEALFLPSGTTGCLPLTVTFENQSRLNAPCGALTYSWEIVFTGSDCGSTTGDWTFTSGNTTTEDIALQFRSAGVYEVRLSVENKCGTSDYTETILVSDVPKISLEPFAPACDAAVLRPELTVTNCNQLSLSYLWEWPDNNSAIAEKPEISFSTVGAFDVSVEVTNACGTATATEQIKILESIQANASLDRNIACVPATLQATDLSTGTIESYLWSVQNLETGGASDVEITDATAKSPSFSFYAAGVYEITLLVANEGCGGVTWRDTVYMSEEPELSIAPVTDICADGSIELEVTYNLDLSYYDSVVWTIPGGVPSVSGEYDPGVICFDSSGTYTIVGKLYNRCGFSEAQVDVRVLEPLVALADLGDPEGCVPYSVKAKNMTLGSDPVYNWRVVDLSGQAVGAGRVSVSDASEAEPEFTFSEVGIYIVELEATNAICGGSKWRDTLFMSAEPEVTFTNLPDFCAGAKIGLEPQYNLPLELIDSVRWTFEGGLPEDPTRINTFFPGEIGYGDTGEYEICVSVYNRCGANTYCQSFRILEPLVADAVLDTTFACAVPLEVGVSNRSTGDDQQYLWRVTGTNPASVSFLPEVGEPRFTFAESGTYYLELEVFNSTCGSSFWRDTVTILLPPTVELTDQDRFCAAVCLQPVPTYSQGTAAVERVQWRFPGGEKDSTDAFLPDCVNYNAPGTYTYTVEVFNVCGSAKAEDTFVIDSVPVLNLGSADTFCLTDGPMQLFPPTPAGGRWSGPGIADAETGLFDPWSIALDGPVTTVEVSYTFANGSCEVTETKNVAVIDMRFVDGGPQVNVCISEEKILLTGGFPAGGWYEGPGVDSGGYFGLQGLTAGDYILTYNYQLPLTACIGSDTFIVSIRPLPIPDFNFVDSLCLGVESRYSGAGSGGNTYEWLFDDGASYTGKEVNHAFTTTGPHEILMLTYSIYGCLDSIRKEVFVSGPPEVAFVKDTTQGCAVLPVNFTNQTIGYQNVRYAWDFGNGQKSTDEQPATVFYQQGLQDTTYFIGLVAKNHCGEDSGLDSILVFPKPLSDAKISQDYGCTPLSIRFNNLTKGLPDEFAWYVNGTFLSSDSIPPDQVFRASGPDNAYYNIQLVSTNECGVDTSMRELIVSPDSIRAFFTADATIGCEPFRVNFKNHTAPDSVVVYNWFFDQNDDTSNAIDTSYTFYATGDTTTYYTVRLEADNGCSKNFFEINITVNPAPKVAFETLSAVCAKDSIAFDNRSIEVNGHLWEFGDGLSSPATNPVHQFETPGRYKVRLTSYAVGTGCPGTYEQSVLVRPLPKPAFSVDKSFGCPPLQVSLNNQTPDAARYYYRWAFGDGNTAVGQKPSPHWYMDSGSFYINLSASDEFGCTGDTLLAQEISVFPVPQPDFAFLPEADCGLPMKVGIDNLTSGASGYRWSFGNGSQESVENNPSTTYLEEGRYQVSVEAKNEFLCAATLVKSIDIYERPLADFSLPKNDWCEEEWIRPENLSLHADRFEWQIGSLRDTSRNPVFAFSNSGIYDLSLIAGNGSGCMDTLQLKNLIEVFPRPTAAFSYLYIDQEAPSTFLFEDQSSEDAVALYWDFGDGKTLEGVSNPVHRYLSSFDKTVVLEVSNEFGCRDTMTQVVDLDTLGGLYIPNILEPDNPTSGKQIFQPAGIGLSEYHIAIYTRNGQMIWESEALNEEGQPTGSWDGTFGGNPLPAGVYVWKVRHARYFNGAYWSGMNDESGKARRTGFVYLVR